MPNVVERFRHQMTTAMIGADFEKLFALCGRSPREERMRLDSRIRRDQKTDYKRIADAATHRQARRLLHCEVIRDMLSLNWIRFYN